MNISIELSRATSVENGLSADYTSQVSIEASTARAAEGSLSSYADSISSAVSAEDVRANYAEGSIDTKYSTAVASIEAAFVNENDIVTESVTGSGYSYTLTNSVENSNSNLVYAFVNGLRVEISSIAGANVTIANPGYTVDSSDTVVFQYEKQK